MQTTATHFKHLLLPAVLLGLFLASGTLHAQYADTFLVTVADKTPEHPHYNVGYDKGYVVNGEQSPTITLVRDSLYLFDTHEVPFNLVFLFYSEPIGGTNHIYSDHVKEQYVSSGIWVIKADDTTPDTLYYASERQAWMGGMILIVDSITTSVEEENDIHVPSTLAEASVYPNPFAGETELRLLLEDRARVRVDVINALGQVVALREVGLLEAGERRLQLSGSDLSPGLYLYRVEAVSGEDRSVATGRMRIIR